MKFTSKLLRSSYLLLVCISLGQIANAQACQNQACFYNGTCCLCQGSSGVACSVPAGQRCSKSCTDTACGNDETEMAGKCRSAEKDKLAALRSPKLILADFKFAEGQTTAPSGTSFLFWPGATSDPLALLSVTHDVERDLFTDGTLKNQSNYSLLAYRIGWLVFSRSSSDPKVIQGSLVELKVPVKPTDTLSAGLQGASPALLQSDPSLIVFFVAEAQFSDGSKWKASTQQIEARYQ